MVLNGSVVGVLTRSHSIQSNPVKQTKETIMPPIPLTDSDFEHYLIAALWSSTDDDEPLDARYETADFHATAVNKLRLDCEAFLVENEQDVAALLDSGYEMPDIMDDF